MENMYREIILDYYRNPRNKGVLQGADAESYDSNPLCGDSIGIHIKLEGNKIKKIQFTGNGCAISQAAVSMLCESVEGKNIAQALAMTKDDVVEMLGVQLTPVRLKCALLGLHVMQKALHEYVEKHS